MLARRYPRADWACTTQDLISVIGMSDAAEIAKVCQVNLATANAWRIGDEPVPFAVFELMKLHRKRELPKCFEKFAGWRLIGAKLVPPGGNPAADGICLSDWPSRREMFQLRQLADCQFEQIEMLTRQRDFYRSQARLEARAGLMLLGWYD
jgi:hypothetical protein